MDDRVSRADDALFGWPDVRARSYLRDDTLVVAPERGSHVGVDFDFAVAEKVTVVASSPLGPSADPEALVRAVEVVNAATPEGPPMEVSGPFVLIRETLVYGPEGIAIRDLEACRQRLVARLDAHHATFEAPGRKPFGVNVGDDGVARLVPHISGR